MSEKICRSCGLCCRALIVQADALDVAREPRIAEQCPPIKPPMGPIADEDRQWMLACGSKLPCPFLLGGNTCQIYPTRPFECLAFTAGGERCRELRMQAELAATIGKAAAAKEDDVFLTVTAGDVSPEAFSAAAAAAEGQ